MVAFIRHDGDVPADEPPPSAKVEPTLAEVRDRYLRTHESSLEPTTLRGIGKHFRIIARHFGEGFHLRTLTLADLQAYVDHRARAKGRRGTLSPATIRKEIVTPRTCWNWAVRIGLVAGRFPTTDSATRRPTRSRPS